MLVMLSHSNLHYGISLEELGARDAFSNFELLKKVKAPPPNKVRQAKIPKGQYLWVVAKAVKSFNVYQFDGVEWIKKLSFPMGYGKNLGNKQRLGDKKTPEGNYWVNNIFPGKRRGPRFGALVFSLNYPNAQDRLKGKTGGGIWIHGPNQSQRLSPTLGCLKVGNKDLLKLLKCEGPLPVVILPKDKLYTHPAGLDLKWLKVELPLWQQRFASTHFNNLKWRKGLYRKAKRFSDKLLLRKKT